MSETNTNSVMDTYKEYPIGDMFAELISEKDIKQNNDQSHTADTCSKSEILPKKYICDECGEKFSYKTNLENHCSLHSQLQQQTFACNLCEKKLDSKTSLDSHLLTHSDLKPFVCNYCHKAFKIMPLLKAHMKVHAFQEFYRLPEKFECDECLLKFRTRRSLKVHIYHVHKPKNEEELLSLCDSCHKTFSNHRTLERHHATHSEIKPYTCGMCQKRFKFSP